MDGIKEILAKMKTLAGEIDKAEAEGKTDEVKVKQTEYDGLKAKAETIKAKARRDKELAEMEEKPVVKSKREEAAGEEREEEATIPDSDHNREVFAKKCDEAAFAYITAPRGQSKLALAKFDDPVIDAIDAKTVGPEASGVRAPRWLSKAILPAPTAERETYAMQLHKMASQMLGKAKAAVLARDTTTSGGGYLVPDIWDPALIVPAKVRGMNLAQRCYVKRAVGQTAYFPNLTNSTTEPFGVSCQWGLEGENIGRDDPAFGRKTIGVARLSAFCVASDHELRVNSYGLEAELVMLLRAAMNHEFDLKIIAGSGTGTGPEPQGILNNQSYADGVVRVARAGAGAVDYADAVKLQFSIDEGDIPSGLFILSGGATGAAQSFAAKKDTYGRPLFDNGNPGFQGGGPYTRLAGSEVVWGRANANALGGRGDMIFGMMDRYGFAVSEDVAVDRSDDYMFKQGLVCFRAQAYVGGKPLVPTSFAILDDVAGASSSSTSTSSSSSSSSGND